MCRVVIETNQNYDPEVSGASVSDQIRVDLVARRPRRRRESAAGKGHADCPLSEAELFDKFRGCIDARNAKIAPDVLFERLNHLEDLSARGLTRND
jgi:hypothetical protein